VVYVVYVPGSVRAGRDELAGRAGDPTGIGEPQRLGGNRTPAGATAQAVLTTRQQQALSQTLRGWAIALTVQPIAGNALNNDISSSAPA